MKYIKIIVFKIFVINLIIANLQFIKSKTISSPKPTLTKQEYESNYTNNKRNKRSSPISRTITMTNINDDNPNAPKSRVTRDTLLNLYAQKRLYEQLAKDVYNRHFRDLDHKMIYGVNNDKTKKDNIVEFSHKKYNQNHSTRNGKSINPIKLNNKRHLIKRPRLYRRASSLNKAKISRRNRINKTANQYLQEMINYNRKQSQKLINDHKTLNTRYIPRCYNRTVKCIQYLRKRNALDN